MTYLLVTKTKRQNAKRHIVERFETIEECKNLAKNLNCKYNVSIYTANWKLVEELR